MNKKSYRKSVELHGQMTFSRPVTILAERYITLAHEDKTVVAIFIYKPEDLIVEDTDEVTGKTRMYRSGQIRYMVAVDGRQDYDGIVDHWGYHDE